MSTKDKGGPAFPITAGNQVYAQGMTLHDWFAGQALAGAMSGAENLGAIPEEKRRELLALVAGLVYEVADAMLAERSK